MRVIKAGTVDPIPLSYRGEQNATQVLFDLTDFIKTFGDGVAQLTVRRAGDPKEYAAAIEQNGSTAVWTVGPEWVEFDGRGQCQLSWHVGGTVAKAVIYKTSVQQSMGASDKAAPEPQAGYLAQVQAAGAQAVAAERRTTQLAGEMTDTARRFDAAVEQTMQTVAQAANAAEQAAQFASAAGQSAGNAEVAERAAGEAKEGAEKAASEANVSAGNAAKEAQAAQDHRLGAEQAAQAAQGYTSHPPTIGENGNWWEWNGKVYVDTGKPSRGEDAAARMVAEVVGETLCLYAESGAPIHAEVKNDTLCIG